MKDRKDYQALLESLRSESRTITVDGLEIEVRSCADRKPGKADPRSAASSGLTEASFRDKAALDPELLGNKVHLIGPENADKLPSLERLRQEFGWRSSDLSTGIRTTCVERPGYCIWQYEVPTAREGRPCLIFIHGGGFFGGDIPTVENQCKLLAQYMGGVVLSVDYPLCPEHKFPQGFNACYDTVCWAYENAQQLGIDPEKIGISGDSAGGNLSVACALRDRDEGRGMLHYQCLIYPTVSREESVDHATWWKPESYDDPENDPLIQQQIRVIGSMGSTIGDWYTEEGQDPRNPYLSPIFADLTGLPRTLVITAEYDFLRAECEAFTRKLLQAGVQTRHIRYGGIFHGTFDRLGYAPQVEDILLEIAQDMKNL
ncbi:MAG: alpha/beta hydrolase [Candidatus Faecousia sp.]|nr:alpha/beta hydrolase [Candidatus Faecousia sp.]